MQRLDGFSEDLKSPHGAEFKYEYTLDFRQELEKKKEAFYSSTLDAPLLEDDWVEEHDQEGEELRVMTGETPFVEAPGARRPRSVKFQAKLKKLETLLPLQVSLLLLLFVDIAATVTLVAVDGKSASESAWPGTTLRVVSVVISFIFLIEMVVIRLIAHGVYQWLLRVNTPFITKAGRALRISILLTSAILETAFLPKGSIVVQTITRCLRIVVVTYEKLTSGAKIGENTVSGCRRRYIAGGYDLDLTYITDTIIAMSWPSISVESLYRNQIDEVRAFLDAKHYSKYKVYNLCSERQYTPDNFHGRVERFTIDDHQPCDLIMIHEFCLSASAYLDSDIQHVIIVHCKGGKGRTGMMICSHLVWSGVAPGVEEARQRFGLMRTEIGSVKVQTVESPSQNLYLKYYESCLTGVGTGKRCVFTPPVPKTLCFDSVVIGPLPKMYAATPHRFVAAALDGSKGDTLWCSDTDDTLLSQKSATAFSRVRRLSKPTPEKGFRQYRVLVGDTQYPGVEELSPLEYYNRVEEVKGKMKCDIWLKFDLSDAPPITGDTRFHLTEEGNTWAESVVWTWFHTSFVDPVEGIYLRRPDVDGAHKDNEHRKFCPEFSLRITFQHS